jgi:hypothetical protein
MPRVSRIEYLSDFMRVVEQGYDRERAEERLGERKKSFEIEKSRALGRGRPFMERLMRTESLREDCQTLTTRLKLVRAKGRTVLELTENGKLFLNADDDKRRKMLAEGLLNTHTAFLHVILTIASAPQNQVDLPMKKDNRSFLVGASRYGFEIGQTDFDVVCELASQFDLINWFPFNADMSRFKRVYSTSIFCGNPETAKAPEPCHFSYGGRDFWIAARDVSRAELTEALWGEYLKLTKYIPRRPVFYSQLRSNVCYRLRICDRLFDTFLAELMISDKNYRLVSSSGSLPYSRDMASLFKSLPPKNERGEYLVYIKMDTKESA